MGVVDDRHQHFAAVVESLAWQFVANPNSGAYSVLAASRLADPELIEQFSPVVTRELSLGVDSIGEAVMLAKLEFSNPLKYSAVDTVYPYNLLADPAAPNPWRK